MKRVPIIFSVAILLIIGGYFLLRRDPLPPEPVGPDLVQRSKPLSKAEAEPQQYLPLPTLSLLYGSVPWQEIWLSAHEALSLEGDNKHGYQLHLRNTVTGKTKVLKKCKPSRGIIWLFVSPDRSQVLFEDEERSTKTETVWSSLSIRGNQPEKHWRFKREKSVLPQNPRWLSDGRKWIFWQVRYDDGPEHRPLEANLFIADENGGPLRHVMNLPDPNDYPTNLSAAAEGIVYAVAKQKGSSEYDVQVGSAGTGAQIRIVARQEKKWADGKRWLTDGGPLTLVRASAPEYEEIEDQFDVKIPPFTEYATVRLSPNERYLLWSITTKEIWEIPAKPLLNWSSKQVAETPLRPPVDSLWVTDLQTGKNTLLGICKETMPTATHLTVFWTQDGKGILWHPPANQGQEKWYLLSLTDIL